MSDDDFNPPPKPRGPGNPVDSPWRSTPAAIRGTRSPHLTLSPVAVERLIRLAERHGGNRSATVERALEVYEAADELPLPERAPTARERIARALAAGPMATAQIVQATGLGRGTVDSALSRARASGAVETDGSAVFWLASRKSADPLR